MTLSEKSWTLVLFVASVISSAWWPIMPDWPWLLLGIITTGSLIKLRRGLISLGVISGFMVVIIHGNVIEYQRQALLKAGVNSTITGEVDSSFKQISHGYAGIVTINHVNAQNLLPFLKPKVRLVTPFPIPVNSEFTTIALVKPVFGLLNEAGFDAEKQAMGKGIVAQAIVPDDATWTIRTTVSLRQAFIDRVLGEISHLRHLSLISALAFADRSNLDGNDWRALRDSGLLHLISISGLHIGMAFSFGLVLGSGVRIIAPRFVFIPSVAGLTAALLYAWMADFSLPTIRAMLVCVIYVLLRHVLIHWSAWRVVLLAVAIQLLIQPFASFSVSFWLSYLSVGLVLFAVHLVQTNNASLVFKIRAVFMVQLYLSFFVVPLSAYFFGGFSFSSILYNLVFIPWFGLVVVPLMFLALFLSLVLPELANPVWQLVDFSLWPLSKSLEYAPGTWLPLSLEMTWLLVLLSVCLILKRFLSGQAWLLLVTVVVCVSLMRERYKEGWRVDVLDVGHGLAVIIEKDGQVLLYDTGKAWQGGSIAEQIITPVLQRRGYSSIDTLVLSHVDNDHAGGQHIIEAEFRPAVKRSSQYFQGYQTCVRGKNWVWQGLDIQVLWPPKLVKRAYNPHSCVLRVSDPESGVSVLLTGDIEAISEWILLREPEKLRSELILVPHHGSKSSSNPRFIEAVSPVIAIASLAKDNQWGMPAKSVVASYQNAGAIWLDTGESGQVTFKVSEGKWYFSTKRSDTFGPWYRQMLRKGLE